MSYYGDYAPASTVVFNFNTASFSDGSPITLAGTPALSVYKNSTTESTTGVTLTVDYDSRTGMHHVVIDTSADGTFYAAGNDFDVVITAGTVGGTSVVGRVVGSFSLNNRSALRPTTAGRTLDVSSGGEAGLDWANIGSPTTTVGLSGTTVGTVTTVTNQLTAAQIATGVWQDSTAGDFTAASSIGKSLYTSGNAPGAASGLALVGSNMGTVTSVTGAVGSVTGNVGGNVVGSVGSVAGNVSGSVNSVATTVSADVVSINSVATSSVTAVNANIGTTQPVNFTGTGGTAYVKTDVIDIAGTAAATELVTAIWDSAISGHTTAGTFGGALNSASSAGDPWATSIPGAYSAGTAGYIVGNLLDVAVSTRSTLTQTQVTGGAYSIQSSSCVLGDARIANLDAAVSTRATVSGILTTQMTESYASLNTAPTLAQAIFAIQQRLIEQTFPGTEASTTTDTVKKIDGSTTAYTLTISLDASNNAIGSTRAT